MLWSFYLTQHFAHRDTRVFLTLWDCLTLLPRIHCPYCDQTLVVKSFHILSSIACIRRLRRWSHPVMLHESRFADKVLTQCSVWFICSCFWLTTQQNTHKIWIWVNKTTWSILILYQLYLYKSFFQKSNIWPDQYCKKVLLTIKTPWIHMLMICLIGEVMSKPMRLTLEEVGSSAVTLSS